MAGYVTLASDSSLDFFPDNEISRFRVKLPRKLYLDRKRHQLGMKYLSYPMKSHNVHDGAVSVLFFLQTNEDEDPVQFDVEIEPGYYKHAHQLTTAINAAIAEIPARFEERYRPIAENGVHLGTGAVKLEYLGTTEKVSISAPLTPVYNIRVQMSKELFVKLGMGVEADVEFESGDCCKHFRVPTTGRYTADLDAGQSAIFVYTDVIEADRMVGHRLVPLLAMAPITGSHGQQCYYEPRLVEYCTPRYDVIDEILIELTGDAGQLLKFTSGKVYLTLHIKDRFEH